MGPEKQGSRGGGGYVGGLFQLFDWNGKSRKKLSYNKFDIPEGTKQGTRSDGNLLATRLSLIEDDENIGVSSVKGSSDYSCASSVTEDDGNGIRAPGVVARLMGLDSLPTSSATEPYLTPFFQPQTLHDTHYQTKTLEYHNQYQNTCLSNQPIRVEGFYGKAMESRQQKLQSSQIERYRTETLPPKSVKPHPLTHHKLLSPIKSPGFIPPKNAADIIEAAAKILEPGYQASAKSRYPSVGTSSDLTRVRDLKENTANSHRPSRLPEAHRKPVESNAVKYLKGQSLNKSWNGPEDTPSFSAYPDSEDSHSVGSRNKGKSVSLAIQAKVNVQRREGLSSTGRTLSMRKDDDEHKLSQPFKCQPSTPKVKQNKSSTSPASGVLRQNNQKQNCATTKEKLLPKPSTFSQQGRRVLSGESSSGRNKTFNKVSGNSKIGYKNGGLEMADLEKEAPSSRTNNLPRKKRAIEGDFRSEKSRFIDAVLVDRGEKPAQPHAVINEHPNLADESRRKGMDVVSFTFSSPMVKPMPGSRSTNHIIGKREMANSCYVDSKKDATDGKTNGFSSLGLNVIGGDALSILLEQKLRELTSEVESSSSNSVNGGKDSTTSASILQDLVSALNAMSGMPRELDKRSVHGFQNDKLGGGSISDCSSINGQMLKTNHNLQGVERVMEFSSSSDARKELDCQHPSPVSILEPSFSNESCNSSETWDVTNGGKLYSSSSVQAQNLSGANCPNKALSVEPEAELSDSASSALRAATGNEPLPRIGMADHMREEKQEMDYVKEIVFNARLTFKDLALGHAHNIIDPCLFDRLESWKIGLRSDTEKESSKVRRREVFDSVNECVETKCITYICGGYKAWAKGAALVRKEGLAEEVLKEILSWRSMGDWMVDELVEKDMSSHLGRWLNFEAEAFEIGVEIERRILHSLLDEVVTDLVV